MITVGPADAKERMKEMLAMGADEGVLVTPPENADYHVISHLLSGAMKKLDGYEVEMCAEVMDVVGDMNQNFRSLDGGMNTRSA